MKVIIAGDHYTIDLVNKIEAYLIEKGYEFKNVGSNNTSLKISLQEIIPSVVKSVRDGNYNFGILVCGTGAGVEIGSNKFKKIRASLCIKPEQAKYAKIYDNSNILCLSSWITKNPEKILDSWFDNEFDKDEKRSKMLKDFDDWAGL